VGAPFLDSEDSEKEGFLLYLAVVLVNVEKLDLYFAIGILVEQPIEVVVDPIAVDVDFFDREGERDEA
jgi:hypothetical protein